MMISAIIQSKKRKEARLMLLLPLLNIFSWCASVKTKPTILYPSFKANHDWRLCGDCISNIVHHHFTLFSISLIMNQLLESDSRSFHAYTINTIYCRVVVCLGSHILGALEMNKNEVHGKSFSSGCCMYLTGWSYRNLA